MATTSRPIDIRSLVQNFVTNLVTAVEQSTTQRIQAALMSGVNGAALVRRGPGRPPKNPLFAAPPALAPVRAPGKRRAKQLCPVPGCKNPAAPVFGMVCAKHKDISKAKIKEYRDARKKAKDKK
jgi:hypothetical protein